MSKHRRHQIQVSIAVRRPKGHRVTRTLLLQALHYRATTGEDPPGIFIRMIIWSVNQQEHYYEGDDVTDALNSMFRMGLEPSFINVQ